MRAAALLGLMLLATATAGGTVDAACPPGQHPVNGKCRPLPPHRPSAPAMRQQPPLVHRPQERVEYGHPSGQPHTYRHAYSAHPDSGEGATPAPPPPLAPASPAAPLRPAPPEPAAVPASPAAPPHPAPAAPAVVPVRVYLRAADIPPPGIAAYGVVALRAKATPASRARLMRVCAAYIASLPRQKSIPSTIPASDQMLTIWPLDDPGAAAAEADRCGYAIDHYDLYGGDSAIRDAVFQGASLGERGPFLIGWSPSSARGVPDQVVLVVDMSDIDSQDSFDKAFAFWKQKIVEDPALWRHGFQAENLRLAVRDFVDHYGGAILAALKIDLWKKE